MKQITFYALREDLLPVLQLVERAGALEYVLTGNFTRNDTKDRIKVFKNGADIPNLGFATDDSSVGCDSYLVCKENASINLRHIPGTGGVERVCVDQLLNPDSVVLTPAGLLGKDIILYGRVATVSTASIAQGLMKRFHTVIKKTFTKIGAFWVGQDALQMAKHGARLTLAAQTPREFDLAAETAS